MVLQRGSLAAVLLMMVMTWACKGADDHHDESLNALTDSISDCLDDPSTFPQADSMLQRALTTPGAEQAEAYPVLIYHQGMLHFYQGEMKEAKACFQRLYNMLPVEIQPDFSVSVPQTLGIIYRREGQTDSAFHYYDRALEGAIALNVPDWLGTTYMNIGVLHHTIGHYSEAEQYLDKAIQYAHEADDAYLVLCVQQVRAGNKLMLKKTGQAEESIREAWPLAQESESADWQVRCLSTMVSLFDELQQPDSANYYIEIGSALLGALPPEGITTIGFLTARANHYYNEKLWAEAIDDYQTLFNYKNSGTREPDVMERMAQSLAAQGRWEEAYYYMDSTQVRRDSLASERMTEQIAKFNVKFQTLEKDLQIARLNMQRLWLSGGLVLLVLIVATLWLLQRGRRLQREAAMRISGMEEERRRLAKELHDGLCNDILALELQCTSNFNKDIQKEGLSRLRHQVRLLSHQLMPPEFTNLSIHQLLSSLIENVCRSAKIDATYQAVPADDDVWRRLSPKVAYELYRMVQEHTSNIVKGGTATQLRVELRHLAGENFKLCMTDNGQMEQNKEDGIGRKTIHDRALSLGARKRLYTNNGMNCLELDFEV